MVVLQLIEVVEDGHSLTFPSHVSALVGPEMV